MRRLRFVAASIVASATVWRFHAAAAAAQATRDAAPRVVIDNPRVRDYQNHRRLAFRRRPRAGRRRGARGKSRNQSGNALSGWTMRRRQRGSGGMKGEIVIVQPRRLRRRRLHRGRLEAGRAQFTGMSFKPIFENDRVSVIRARMEVGAREGFHTHGSDTVVVHLSGGEIEDTADGKTVVNRWKPGDVEFEGSARATRHATSAAPSTSCSSPSSASSVRHSTSC